MLGPELRRRIRYTVGRVELAPVDAVIIMASMVLALWITHDRWTLMFCLSMVTTRWLAGMCLISLIYVMLFTTFRLYRFNLRFSGLEMARSVALAALCGLPFVVTTHHALYDFIFPRSVLGIFLGLVIFLVGGLRIVLRVLPETFAYRKEYDDSAGRVSRRALIVGDSESGAQLARAIREDPHLRHYSIVGLLDDDQSKTGVYYGNVQVLGPRDLIYDFLDKGTVDEVMFIVSDASRGEDLRPLALECRRRQVPAKIVSDVTDRITKPAHLRIEDIQVEDFLRRPAHNIDIDPFGGYLTDRKVLVTGAGGSIGSEICRQVMKMEPSQIILLGHGENSIFAILQELRRRYPDFTGSIYPVIASVTDANAIARVFRTFKPEMVFHAAAHKHLALMEQNVLEAVQNNVLGTNNVARACAEYGVERMVLISTDKAADPICVMGATKALCELVVRSLAKSLMTTKYVCVRFGNVLGSRGSVIPVFSEQIRTGGPVTVTHPDMTRYFMTIPEAVRLVIQAGSIGNSGDVYLLDMGKPVRILDLAQDMIRLYGYEPYTDIDIVFSGIRPGEKIHETLTNSDELIERTEWEGLSRVHGRPVYQVAELNKLVSRFDSLLCEQDSCGVLDILQQVLPHFVNNESLANNSCNVEANSASAGT